MIRPAGNSSGRKALLITRNLPPLLGGMERLNHRIADILSRSSEVTVVGPTGCAAGLGDRCVVHEVAIRPIVRFLAGALFVGVRLARRLSPDVVFAGSGLTAPLAWAAARVVRARSVVYLHGLDVVVANPVYQACWLPFIRRADLCFANSANTRRLAMRRGVSGDKIAILHPGTELPGFDESDRGEFRIRHGLGPRQPVLLSVGRITKRKGVAEFVLRAFPRVLEQHPDAVLVVIGDDAIDALHGPRDSERARLVAAAQKAGVAHAVRLMAPCSDLELTAAYRASDVYVFPVLELPGDVEGFGMVAIEAAAHGLPTVAFAVGGVPDAVVEGVTGTLVEAHDYVGFAAGVEHWLVGRDQFEKRSECFAAARRYGWDNFAEGLDAGTAHLFEEHRG